MRAVPFLTAAIAFAVYAASAARTITWWDGSNYPLAAVTLGIPGAPGSLILTLLGWVVSQIPVVHPVAFRLNLLAGLIAATTAGLVAWLGARLATPEGREPGGIERFAGALAGLTLAFGPTSWTYAVQFTPYGLSALWTTLLLLAALAWWRRPEASRGHARLFLLFLLFGLDFSVHRTNALLLPAALLWVTLRSPGSGSRLGEGLAAAAGLALGLAFHLLLIPLAARRPPYMVEGPVDLAAWWSYVTIEQQGGGFLVHLWPRTADFLSVQLADYVAFLRRNLGVPLYLPLGLAVLGWIVAVRHHPRRALGMLALFLAGGLGAVVYFNLPRSYFRPIDRHYLPSLVVLAPWIAVGAAAVLRQASHMPGGRALAPGLALLLASSPLAAWRAHRETCDLSRNPFAEGFARDLLEPLPERAILLTNGDNDSMPLWYMQEVEAVRRDVTVINLPTANTGSMLARIRRSDPDFAGLLEGEPERGVLPIRSVRDSSVTTRVEARTGLGLPPGVAAPESVVFRPTGDMMGSDRVVLDLLRLNRWRRPVYLASTVVRDQVPWLWPYARLDGLAFRVIPSDDPAVWDVDHLRTQLFERVRYQGLADLTVRMDVDSRAMGGNYTAALFQLAWAQLERCRPKEALATIRFIEDRVPPARVGRGQDDIASLRRRVESEFAGITPKP